MYIKIMFYGNILADNILTDDECDKRISEIIDEFLPLGMEIYNTTRKLIMPRKIIRDYPSTLDINSDLYINIEKLKQYFGEELLRIDYIPVSGDLFLDFKTKELFLSNILLGIIGGIGDIKKID